MKGGLLFNEIYGLHIVCAIHAVNCAEKIENFVRDKIGN